MKKLPIYLLAVSVLFAACNNRSESKKYGAAALGHDDSTFLALKDTAQKKIQMFIDSLDTHGKDYEKYSFIVKSDFTDKSAHEHMWSRVFERNNGVFKGIFIDSAFDLKNIKTGDSVFINKSDIEDWAIANKQTGETIGGFSIKYLRNKMRNN